VLQFDLFYHITGPGASVGNPHPPIACLHDQSKRGVWRAGFYSANQSFLKTFQIALIGWIEAGSPKSHFCFDHVNRPHMKLTVIKSLVQCF